MSISSLNTVFDQLLEWSHINNSNKWLNIGFGEEPQEVSLEIYFMHPIWGSDETYVLDEKAITLLHIMFIFHVISLTHSVRTPPLLVVDNLLWITHNDYTRHFYIAQITACPP